MVNYGSREMWDKCYCNYFEHNLPTQLPSETKIYPYDYSSNVCIAIEKENYVLDIVFWVFTNK